MAAAAELQKAIEAVLARDPGLAARIGGVREHDGVPLDAHLPCVTFACTGVHDWSTGAQSATEQLLTLHLWSREDGREELQALLRALAARLEAAGIELERHVDLRPEFSEVVFDEDLSVHHGLLRFRALSGPP